MYVEHRAILDSLFSFAPQETLEDIDKNGDGFVDQDEYIGERSPSLAQLSRLGHTPPPACLTALPRLLS